MSAEAAFERALLLFHQDRHELAETELRGLLSRDPNLAPAHSLLAMCLSEQEKWEDAGREADLGVGSAPDLAFCHYARAHVLNDRNRFSEAEAAVREAIRLDPEDEHQLALLASVLMRQSRWKEALEAADRGLRIAPENVGCLNLRAMALQRLGRKGDAHGALQSALAKEPENALTHANRGWTLLSEGRDKEALEHFREALRLEPDMEWAQKGIVEALKARYFIYRWILRYYIWMGGLGSRARWGVILGGYATYRVAGTLAKRHPEWQPVLIPVIAVYILFVLMSWLADPVFNLLLRLNKFGRLAVSAEQRRSSNWVGACLAGCAASVAALLATGLDGFGMTALVSGLLAIPMIATFHCDKGWPRTAMGAYTAGLAALGFTAAALAFFQPAENSRAESIDAALLLIFFLGAVLSSWMGNILAAIRPKK